MLQQGLICLYDSSNGACDPEMPSCPTERQRDLTNLWTCFPQSKNNTVELLVWSEGSTVLQLMQMIVSADRTSVSRNTVGLENKYPDKQ